MVPPDPIPNSEVKRRCADGSVGLPHVRVGHRQVLNVEPRAEWLGVFVYGFEFDKLKCGRKLGYFHAENKYIKRSLSQIYWDRLL